MKKLFKKIICAGLVAAVLMSVLSFGSIYAIAADSGTGGYESLNGKNWMSAIADDRYIYEINLPGTQRTIP